MLIIRHLSWRSLLKIYTDMKTHFLLVHVFVACFTFLDDHCEFDWDLLVFITSSYIPQKLFYYLFYYLLYYFIFNLMDG